MSDSREMERKSYEDSLRRALSTEYELKALRENVDRFDDGVEGLDKRVGRIEIRLERIEKTLDRVIMKTQKLSGQMEAKAGTGSGGFWRFMGKLFGGG